MWKQTIDASYYWLPPSMCFNDDGGDSDGGGSGGDIDSGDSDGGSGNIIAVPEGGQALVLSASQVAVIDDKYKNEGQIDAGRFMDGYSNLRSTIGRSQDEIRSSMIDTVRTEVRSEIFGERPGSIDGYQIPTEGTELGLPEGVNFTPDPDNPLGKWWTQFCFDKGLSSDIHLDGVKQFVAAEVSRMPDYKAEYEKLGADGEARSGYVGDWFEQKFGVTKNEDGTYVEDENYKRWAAFDSVLTTAEGIQMAEWLMNDMGADPFKGDASGDNKSGEGVYAGLTEGQVEELQNSEAYNNPSHQDFNETQKKVEAYYKAKNEGKRFQISNSRLT